MSETWDGLAGALAGAPSLPGANCRGRAQLFSEPEPTEQPDTVKARQTQALGLCSRCPSLKPCKAWFQSLPPSKKPGGIIAGQIHTWKTTTRHRKDGSS